MLRCAVAGLCHSVNGLTLRSHLLRCSDASQISFVRSGGVRVRFECPRDECADEFYRR